MVALVLGEARELVPRWTPVEPTPVRPMRPASPTNSKSNSLQLDLGMSDADTSLRGSTT